MMKNTNVSIVALCTLAGFAASALAQTIHPEVEPNANKGDALANGPFVLAPGDGVTGQTMGTSNTGTGIDTADYFLIKTTPQSPGIYRHTMTFSVDSGALPFTSRVTLRGLSQSTSGIVNPNSDMNAQSARGIGSTRVNSWYGFGREEQVFYAVEGKSDTTGTYTSILSTEPVPVTNLGTFEEGTIEIASEGFASGTSGTQSSFWVYDDNLNPIPDFSNVADPNVEPGTSPNSRLVRTFAPGTYHLAVSQRNLITPLPSASDDRSRNARVADFPDIAFSSNTLSNRTISFAIIDQFGPTVIDAVKPAQHTITWYKFEVGQIPAGSTGGCCLSDGTCVIATSATCDGQGGAYQGDGSDCNVTCPVTEGACCFDSAATCVILTASECAAMGSVGGTYQGDATDCATASCPSLPIAPIAEFTGEETELFDNLLSNPGQCLVDSAGARPFNDQASICNAEPNGNMRTSGSWGFHCSIRFTGSPMGIANNNGPAVITFDQPIERFGGYFGTNAPSPGGQWAEVAFYDPNNVLVGVGRIDGFTNNCDWYWGGWEFSEPVVRVELLHSRQHNYLFMGRLDIDWFTGAPPCYADCNGDNVLNIGDFLCFIDEFAVAQTLPPAQQQAHYANCTGATAEPFLTVADFLCFIDEFAQGCP